MNPHIAQFFSFLLAGCLLLFLSGPVSAAGGDPEITFHDISAVMENTGLSLDLTVTNKGEGETESCFLDLFASPTAGTTKDAILIGWTTIPVMQGGESTDYRIEISMPDGLIEGEYFPTASIACYDMTESYQNKVSLKPGSGVEAYLAQGISTACSGPDYQITGVTVPVTPAAYEVFDTISLTVTVTNRGFDDTGTALPIHAYLGDRELGPLNTVISPLATDEVSVEKVTYLIPEDISRGSYPLTLFMDPYRETGQCRAPDDLVRTGTSIIIIEDTPPMIIATPTPYSGFPAYQKNSHCSICDHLVDF
ncbi:MAG: hypothetical protein JXA44_06480 [Methanospirillaceae archaeon]|nr:hypothetical protein [Methanospirillaceae archaeon]